MQFDGFQSLLTSGYLRPLCATITRVTCAEVQQRHSVTSLLLVCHHQLYVWESTLCLKNAPPYCDCNFVKS